MKAILVALFASGLFMSPALAAPIPATKAIPASIESQVLQVRERDRNYRKRNWHSHHHLRHHRHRYRPGHRYRHRPHGWHRYHHRPHGWYARGCIIVGPLWFCP